MSEHGFYLTRLSLVGTGLANATVELTDGLNVISGPSDTGKTFIAQCIDYMFGASKPPELVPEAEGYESVELSLVARRDSRSYTLRRSVRGGGIIVTSGNEEDFILAEKHEPGSTDTVSYFLLDISGLAGRLVRTNKRGTTRQVSFRDIARLIVVDEETVISKRSPILTGQYTTATTERNVFRLLLTGTDDSSVQESPDHRLSKQREEGQAEIVAKVREGLLERIRSLGSDESTETLRERLSRVEADFNSLSSELEGEQNVAFELETNRRETLIALRRIDSRIGVIRELEGRFELLDRQYASDIRRLEAIAEAGTRLEQLQQERCPVCGALPEHNAEQHIESSSPRAVAIASEAESQRIRVLVSDLANARKDNEQEMTSLRISRDRQRAVFSEAGERLDRETKPRIQEVVEQMRGVQERRNALIRIIDLHEQLGELDGITQVSDSTDGTTAADPASTVGTGEAEEFSKEVENLLRSWHFPALDRVVFSEQNQDVIISGRRRSSHGKGVRAITHAAFNIALEIYCTNRQMPHPGTVVIDSPLVVYREPDDDEGEFSTEVKDMFYRSLATGDAESQVIVLENDDPPADVQEVANVIKFTGSVIGRSGFIPPRPESTAGGA